MLRILFAFILLMLSASAVQASASCSVRVDDLDFGTVDTIGGTQTSTSTDVAISCSGITPGADTITMCGAIGAGSGGETGGVRQSISGGGTLGFVLYADGTSVPWGDASDLGEPYKISIPASGSDASLTVHLFGVVPHGQAGAAVGEYSANFTTSDADFKYAEGSFDCAAPPPDAGDATASFAVTASVPANCLLQTADLNFGTTGLIGHNIDAQTSIGVTCTPDTGYAISIDGGSASDPDHRLMHATGSNTVSYGLYSDQPRSLPWGLAGHTVSGTGDGSKRNATVYGRIPPQSAAPGSYTDMVVVTISY